MIAGPVGIDMWGNMDQLKIFSIMDYHMENYFHISDEFSTRFLIYLLFS